MKILHFLWSFSQGGAENLAVDLANEQCRDHDVVMLIANKAVDAGVQRRLDPNVRFIHLGRPENSRNPYWIAKLLVAMRIQNPDVVHAHSSNLASLAPFIGAPLVLTVHANGILLSRHAGQFSAICCISRAVNEDIATRYPNLQTILVPNGIRTADIAVRESPAMAPSPIRAIQVSRLVHTLKGQDVLIEALAILKQREGAPVATVDFVGDGASLRYLEEIAASYGVEDRCRFLGSKSRDEVFGMLKNYDVLVQPSRDEGFGLTVAEGMAAKLAVIVSDLPGPLEVIDGGRYGYHFRCGNPHSLATTLQTVAADCRHESFNARRNSARQFVVDTYDLTRTSEHYVRVYKEVASV